MKKKLVEYEVEGRGTFPFDMLRYDASWPIDQAASARIEGKEQRTVRLSSHRSPTPERWSSFGWKVWFDAGPREFGPPLTR